MKGEEGNLNKKKTNLLQILDMTPAPKERKEARKLPECKAVWSLGEGWGRGDKQIPKENPVLGSEKLK